MIGFAPARAPGSNRTMSGVTDHGRFKPIAWCDGAPRPAGGLACMDGLAAAPSTCHGRPVSTEPDTMKPLLTNDEVADLLGVRVRHRHRLRARGVLPCVKIGRAVRFRPADVAAFVDRHLTGVPLP